MYKWHAAINDNIHKHVLFGFFNVHLSISVTEPFATPKKRRELEGREHSHPHQSQTSWLGFFLGKVGDTTLN